MNIDINTYKEDLFKLWKHSCDNHTVEHDNINRAKDFVINFKDNFIYERIDKVFNTDENGNYIDIKLSKHSDYSEYVNFEEEANSDDKIIILKYILNIYTNSLNFAKPIEQLKEKKSFFEKNVYETVGYEYNRYKFDYDTPYARINNIITNETENYFKILSCSASSKYRRLDVGMAIIIYNNIQIPITFEEYDELKKYGYDSFRKKDMININRHLTLLTPSDFTEFMKWKTQTENEK